MNNLSAARVHAIPSVHLRARRYDCLWLQARGDHKAALSFIASEGIVPGYRRQSGRRISSLRTGIANGVLPFESFVQTCWGERRLLAPAQASVLPGVAGGTEELGGFAGCPEGRSCRGLEGITTLSFAFFGFLTSRPLASRLPILAPSSRKIYCDNRELNERFRQEQPGAELLQPSPVQRRSVQHDHRLFFRGRTSVTSELKW